MLKWYLGSFQTGIIERGTPLPVIKGSSKIYHDINGESDASLSLSVADLKPAQRKNWKLAFEAYNKGVCAIDDSSGTEKVVFWGFVDSTQIEISSGTLEIKASGMLEYLKTRIIHPVFTQETDATKKMVFQAANWNGVLKRLINNAMSIKNFPADAPRPPRNMDLSAVQAGKTRRMECLYTEAFTYADKMEEVRDEASDRGEEFVFSSYTLTGGNLVKLTPLIGTHAQPKVRYNQSLNIALSDNAFKILSSSSVSSGEGKATRFLVQSKNDEKETDLTARYTRNRNAVLVDDFWNSSVELTTNERIEQLNARAQDMEKDLLELELEVVADDKRTWLDHLGKKVNLSGVPDTISEGHDAVVRLVGVTIRDDSRVILDVMTPQQRYPRLPKRRVTEEKRQAKKDKKLKNQKYYKGGSPKAWDRSALGGGGYSIPGGSPGGGTIDPVAPGDLGPGLGGEWGTGGAGEEGEVPIEGDVDIQYRYISEIKSELFTEGTETIAQNNTIWNISDIITEQKTFPTTSAHIEATSSFSSGFTSADEWTGRINAGIIYRGGISDPGVAKHVVITGDMIDNFLQYGFQNFFPSVNLSGWVEGSYTYKDVIRMIRVKSYNIVVIDNHVFLPIRASIHAARYRKSTNGGSWSGLSSPVNTLGGFLAFLKAPITSTREVGEFSWDYRSFRGDMGYMPNVSWDRFQDVSFTRYGSWIVMTPGNAENSPYGGAANYATGGSAFSTWWNWHTNRFSRLGIAKDKFGRDLAVIIGSVPDPYGTGTIFQARACLMETFPVPKEDQDFTPIQGMDGLVATGGAAAFAAGGRVFIQKTVKEGSGTSAPEKLEIYLVDANEDGTGFEATLVGETALAGRYSTFAIKTIGSGKKVYSFWIGTNNPGIQYGVVEEPEE